MKAIMVMYDSLRRDLLESYGCDWTKTPNFKRLADLSVQFENCYVGSMPCMPARAAHRQNQLFPQKLGADGAVRRLDAGDSEKWRCLHPSRQRPSALLGGWGLYLPQPVFILGDFQGAGG